MLIYLQILVAFFILIAFHELGHIVSAKILGLQIQKIGFLLKPYPHFYVAVGWPKTKLHKYIYLFSGSLVTVFLFIILISNNFFGFTFLYWAFLIQFAIEFNPFYSDFTIAFVSNNSINKEAKSYAENYAIQFKKYQFSLKWYAHFILWTLIIILLIQIKNSIL